MIQNSESCLIDDEVEYRLDSNQEWGVFQHNSLTDLSNNNNNNNFIKEISGKRKIDAILKALACSQSDCAIAESGPV